MPEDRTSFDFRHERLQLMGFRTQEPLVKSKDDANVDDWIKGVRALKEKRRIEDEARNRQLEEDILKERRARQERRALRGRSVSPSKSPADSTSSKAHDLEPTASIEAGSTMQLTATGRDDSRSVTERRRALVSSLLLNGLPSSKPEVQMTIQDSTHQTRRPSVQAETKLLLASAESRTAGNMDVPPQKPRPNSERILEVNTSNIYDTTPVSDDAGTFSSLRQGLRSTNTVRSRISDPVKENLLTAKSSLRLTALPGKSVSQPEQRTQISLDARSNQAPDITKSKLSSLPESHVRLDDAISKLREGVISETSRSTPATTVHFSSTLAGILLKNRPEAKAVNRSFDSSRIQPAGPSNDKLRHLTKDRARRPRGRNQIVSATSEDLQPSQESTLFTQVVAMPQEAKRSSNSQMNIPDQRWREEMLRGAWSDTEASTLKDEKRHSLSPPTTSRGDITENVRQSASQPAVIVKSKTSCSVPTASPFSNLPVRPKTTSKSMSSLTSIADLIRGRADSISKVQKSRDVNMERPSVVQVWKLLETTLERVEFRSIWNLFYEDVTLLMEVAMQNSKTCWYKWIGISSRIENKGEANALCGPGNIPVAVRQGKEPASFCDFLQGVICTRSPAVLESASALYSVRKFHTGFAVDQIPCNAEALCSGFVFVLVSADWPTKIWIGSGSLPAELDVARSAAIELSKHPKVIEMSEGSEDLAFWEQTAGPAKYGKKLNYLERLRILTVF